jgi:AraC-like DNA-binding protein
MTIALRHSDRVAASITRLDGQDAEGLAKFSHIERSWLRSAHTHRLSPDAPHAPHILTATELHPMLQDSAGLIEHARPELDGLYAIIGRLDYTVLLSNRDGVIVDHRGESDLKSRFRSWGSWLGQTIDLKALAAEARLSAFHFARAFKQSQGVTPHHFILQRRLEKARQLLEEAQLSLAEIATSVGFADQSHFSRRFRDHVGISPGEFRRRRQPVEDSQASAMALTEPRIDKAGL